MKNQVPKDDKSRFGTYLFVPPYLSVASAIFGETCHDPIPPHPTYYHHKQSRYN